MLRLRQKNIESLSFLKFFDDRFTKKIAPAFRNVAETLVPEKFESTFLYSDDTRKDMVLEFFPQHILYEYSGMICTISYPEAKDLYKIYGNVVNRLKEMSDTLTGDFSEIQQKIVFLLCRQFHFRFPRIYKVSDDKSTLECILSFNEETQNLAFFDHDYNRNSLGATAIIDDEIVFATKLDRQIRDIRRIWQKLDTPGAIAIPLHISETVKSVLVCDFLEPVFELDMSKEIIFKYFAIVLGMTLKPYFKN